MNKKNTLRFSKKLSLWIAFGVLGTLLAALALLPSIFSSNWGKTTLLTMVNSQLNGRVEIDKLNLSWFSGQKVEGLRVFSNENATIGTVETAQTESWLLPLLFGHISGQSEIANLHLEIIPYTDGTTNLDFLLKKTAVVLNEQKLPSIILNNVQIVGSTKPLINLHLTGTTSVDSREGAFVVEILTLPENSNIQVDAHITNFPVLVLDRLVALKNPSLKGSLLTLLGETLNVDASQVLEKNNGSDSFSIYKILLNIAGEKAHISLQGKGSFTKDQQLIIAEPATVTLSAKNTDLIITIAPFTVGMDNPKIENLQATIHSPLHPDNVINFEWSDQKHVIIADGNFDNFPIGLLSTELETIFGANIKGSIHLSIKNQANGNAKIVLNGTNGSIDFDARYEHGVLLLNKPMHGSVLVNERLAKTIIKKMIPFFEGLVSADNPISFRLEPDNFVLPLFPFDLQNISVGLATIEFGNMQFRNEGPLGKMLSILKPGNGPLVSLWFTPMYFHLQQGALDLERVDLLMQGNYPIAAWGNIDLINEEVDMQVGLSSYTIAHAFNVQIGDTDAYVAVPLRGPLKRPTFDKASATAQITALVAQNQAGAPGMILGAVLQIASRTASTSAPIPPPTTNPLPWEGQIQMDQVDSSNSSIGFPIKSVTEGAGKLIKNLFK